MRKKIGLLCLSVMVVALAVACSTDRNNTIRTNVNSNEASRENRSEEKTRRKDESESSNDDILSEGESTIVSKNIIDTNNKISQDTVTITLDNVIKGNEAKKIVDNYNKESTTSKIPDLVDNSLEYVIVEYTTTLPNDIKSTKDGQSSHVGIQVCNLDNSQIQSNNVNYILRSLNFEKAQGLQSDDSGVTRVVLTLPKDITEFIIKLGDYIDNQASYIID